MSWRSTRLKFLASVPIVNGLGEAGSFDDPDWPRYIRTTDIAGPSTLREDTFASLPSEVANKAPLKRGDVLMTAAGATVGKSFRYDSDAHACYAGYLVRFRAKPDVDSRFVSYWTESIPYWNQIHSGRVTSTIDNFSAGRYQNLRIKLPELDAQRAIVNFLDDATPRIEMLIEKHRRLANVLIERRDVYIERRVDTAGPRRPLKRAWNVVDCKHRTPPYVEDGFAVISPGDISPGRLDLSRAHRFVNREDFQDLTEPRLPSRGDIVYSRNASVGTACYVDSDEPFCLGQDVCLITSPDQDQRFLMYALNSVAVQQIEQAKQGSTFSRIDIAQILELLVPVPPRATQTHIADELDRVWERTRKNVALIERQIELLRERKQALITAAVTGQISIPVAS